MRVKGSEHLPNTHIKPTRSARCARFVAAKAHAVSLFIAKLFKSIHSDPGTQMLFCRKEA